MFNVPHLKEAVIGDTFKAPSGLRIDSSDIEYEVTSVSATPEKRHVTLVGRIFGVEFSKTDAIIRGNQLTMHSVIL